MFGASRTRHEPAPPRHRILIKIASPSSAPPRVVDAAMTQDCDKTFLRFDSKDSTPLESFPSAAPSLNLTPSLDATSWEHVDKLCEQLLHCSKVSVERWKVCTIPHHRLRRRVGADPIAHRDANE